MLKQTLRGVHVGVSRSGADFGLVNVVGSAGREYVPGAIHRSDLMAAEGLYEAGKKRDTAVNGSGVTG